jgi:hypothetical protein
MHTNEFIPAGEFCAFHHIELSFVRGLHESGLIGLMIRDGAVLLPAEDLPALEKFVRWHYDLAINAEGIEAIAHLLGRLEVLQEEKRVLSNRLKRYE